MGIIKNGILGGFKGKVGAVVGYQLMGQEIMRGMPESRTSDPTEKEMANRRKFAVSQAWLQPITAFVRIGFQGYKPTSHGFVAAKSYISKNALRGEDPDYFIDPALACVSYGSLPPGHTSTAVAAPNRNIIFTWDYNGEEYAYDDRAMVLAYDIENEYASYDTSLAQRLKGTGTLQVNEKLIGKTAHIYLAFVSEDRSNRSISQYLGTVTVLA